MAEKSAAELINKPVTFKFNSKAAAAIRKLLKENMQEGNIESNLLLDVLDHLKTLPNGFKEFKDHEINVCTSKLTYGSFYITNKFTKEILLVTAAEYNVTFPNINKDTKETNKRFAPTTQIFLNHKFDSKSFINDFAVLLFIKLREKNAIILSSKQERFYDDYMNEECDVIPFRMTTDAEILLNENILMRVSLE